MTADDGRLGGIACRFGDEHSPIGRRHPYLFGEGEHASVCWMLYVSVLAVLYL
jgi:hypothetical protein